MLDGLLQGQDLVEEGALEHRFKQAELLLVGHLPPLLQFGLEALHRLQGTLCICKPSHISVTAPARGGGGGGEACGRDRWWREVMRTEALSVQTGSGVRIWPH